MDAELDDLHRQIQQLRTQNEQLQQQVTTTADTQAQRSESDAPVSNPGVGSRVTECIVLLPRERRCSIFTGGPDEDIFEWIEDV